MSCRRERVWKGMVESDTNSLKVLVILMALGGQQRGWDFILRTIRKSLTTKKNVYLCAIYTKT